MKALRTSDFRARKQKGQKISFVTAYDYPSAQIVAESEVDAILVGDSVSMVVHGLPSTVHATSEMMELHTSIVRRGAPDLFIASDMPFLTFRKGTDVALSTAERLMRAGASAVKLEGVTGHEDVVSRLVESGIPVMGHVGLVPQSVNQLGGYKVQGRTEEAKERILKEAKTLQLLGAFSIVLEAIPSELAREITSALEIVTIGIGAGPGTDGQVLVWHDLLGITKPPLPKFVRGYSSLRAETLSALNSFHKDVVGGNFPGKDELYT